LHKALGGGYMNPLATHYDNVSQKIDNRAAQVGKKETIQKIASKIASPAVMRKIGMNEGELEEDLSRRGFLRGLGAAAGAAALGTASKAQAGQGQNLGNGFVLTTVDVFGGKFKAVLDTQSDIHYIPNRNESGGAIVRSMAPFIMIKNGQTNTAMNVGPAAQAALKKAGLLKGVEESMAEGEIDTSRMNKQHQDFYNTNPNFKRNDREATSVGGRLATKVTPKTAQVTKKPMTPFESIDNAWDAAKKKVSEGSKK
jgi:hypothetical protein